MFLYLGTSSIYSHEYSRQLQRAIEEDGDDHRFSDIHTHYSYKIDKFLMRTGIDEILEFINFFLTFGLFIFYIISTYTYPEITQYKHRVNKSIDLVEIFVWAVLVFHFVLRFYISSSRLLFLFDFINLIDLSSLIFIILAKTKYLSYNTKFFFRLFRIVRMIYLMKLESILQKKFNETVRYSYKLLIYFLSIFCISTSCILEIENYRFRRDYGEFATQSGTQSTKANDELFRFHDMTYFELVTFTTIGYGDVTPKETSARFIVIITIILILIVVLPIYSKLKIIFALTSKYSRLSYQKKSQKIKHILILGDCGVESFEAFLEELYNDDHGDINYDTVILQSSPNEQLMKLIKSLPYFNKIFYLVGNCLVHKDLERCSADSSICAVILANKLAKNPRQEDFSNIMKAFSFRKYSCINGMGADTRICIQLLRPETKEIYFSSLANSNDPNSQDQIICVEEIKLQLLGKSCLCQGITTIISALITSDKPEYNPDYKFTGGLKWLNEYLYGIRLEIYVVKLRAELIHNMKFIDVVRLVYEVAGLIVIGIDVIIDDYKPFVCLNPASYFLSPFDNLVYILADSQPNDNELNSLIKEHLEKNQKGIVENNMEMVKLLRLKNPFWNNKTNKNNLFNNENSHDFDSNDANQILKKNNRVHPILGRNPHNSILKKTLYNITNQTQSSQFQSQQNHNDEDTENYKKKLESFTTIKHNFFHTILPRTQHEAETFSPDILDRHIIVCGIGLNLKNLLMPLRASSMKNQQYPILIIDKNEHIPSEIWKEIQYYPDIYFMQGNPIKSKDLHKAGIKKARAVIILSKPTTDVDQVDMVDADTIFIYKAIKNETKNALIIAELVSVSAISFINSSNDDSYVRKQGYWLSQPFALGEIYISSMLDTLICQAFYNPYITDILQQLIMGSAGSNFAPGLRKKMQEKKITQSTLYLLNINDELGRLGNRDFPKKVQFKELFKFFSKNNMVPIGINRNSARLSTLKNNKNDKRYVYLCPKNDDLIDIDHDKIYILAGEDYYSLNKKNDPYKMKNNAFYQFNKTSKLIDKSNELVLDLAQGMKNLIDKNSKVFSEAYSVKKVVSGIRCSIRNELADMHDKLVTSKYINDDGINEENIIELNNSNTSEDEFSKKKQ